MITNLETKPNDKNRWLENQLLIFENGYVVKNFCNMKIPVIFIGTSGQTAKGFLCSEIIWGHK